MGCDTLAAADERRQKPVAVHDIRLAGFPDRTPLSAAWTWLDAQPAKSKTEIMPLALAVGRVLAEPVVVGNTPPARTRAGQNGYAVRAAECDGASAYNPLLLALQRAGIDALPPGSACPIATGWTLPIGSDAVLPFEAAHAAGLTSLEVLAPVAPGMGIERHAPAVWLGHGHRLRPQDVSALAADGVGNVPVIRRLRVAIVVPGPKSGHDALTPMLRTLLTRDQAVVEAIPVSAADELALAAALTNAKGCDLVLLAGRSGAGLDDTAALAVHAAGGMLVLHGIALRPGGSAGLGTLPDHNGVPIILLPGEPFACLVAYDMLAGRLLRRLAGVDPVAYPVAEFTLSRKIVSGIGSVEIVPVRLTGDQVQPIAIDAGLAGTLRACGFVIVPAPSEGYATGARVQVHLYGARQTGAV